MHNFRELKVWQKGIDFTVSIYKLTGNFPSTEKFNLVSQLNRASTSIPSIIAEGAGRNTNKDFNNFLGTALGSAFEVETELLVAHKLNYLSKELFDNLANQCVEIQKMIVNLQKNIMNK